MHPAETTTTPVIAPYAHPLDEFYAQSGRVLPRIEVIAPEKVPQPYRDLLVHQGDMTPTLEKFHNSTIHLEVLRREERAGHYFREVVLLTDKEDKRVEFGAIKVSLELFPSSARREILEERLPLGALLAKYKIGHTSRPKAFLRVPCDQFIAGALSLSGKPILYGRRNTLRDLEGRPLAEIVEILPPANQPLSK
jgi:chorismate-pyruvate lyase